MSGELQYGDLLGVAWRKHGRTVAEGMDCSGICKEVLRRVGVETPEEAWRVRVAFTGEPIFPDCWEKLGDGYLHASQVGDVLVSSPMAGESSEHVSVIINPTYFSTLSTSVRTGGFVQAAYAIQNVIGAYRFKG